MNDVQTMLTAAGAAVLIIGSIYATYRRFRPSVRRGSAALDAIIGKEAVTDRSGNIIEPSQPGLVHRVATVEEAVVEIRHVVELWTQTQHKLNEHEARIKTLEDSRLERLVSRAESAQMWRAVADNADNAITDAD